MNPTKRWVVYQHENLVNGKKYIGITGRKPESRWRNGDGYVKNFYFSSAIRKYGWGSFKHEVLYSGLTQEEAETLEAKLIAELDTTNPDKGYNLAPGGCFSRPTSATRARMSEACKGHVVAPEVRERLREANLGKTLSAEAKEKLRVFQTGRTRSAETRAKIGANSPRARAVFCEETGQTYPSVRAAARAASVDNVSVLRVCQGKIQAAKGYHWRFV